MEVFIAGLFAVCFGAVVFGIVYSLQGNRLVIMKRLKTYTVDAKQSYLPPDLYRPLKSRIKDLLTPFSQNLSQKLIPANKKAEYERKLLTAGNPLGLTVENYLILKYCAPPTGAFIGLIIGSVWVLLLLLLAGLFMPDLWLKASEERRKDEMLRNLPDILDLLSVSVEAGLSFDGALQKVIEKSRGPLTKEFEIALREIEMGKQRREALKDLAERVNIDDVSLFVGSVMQAEQLGVPMANVLRLQSKQVRENRRMRAEEKAQKAPVKILIPMMFFIFPTIFIVLLGPAMIKLLDNFK